MTNCIRSCVLTIAVALAGSARLFARTQDDPPAAAAPEVKFHVRPGSQELLDHAEATMEKVRTRTERLASRAAKGDDLKGKSDSLRKEIIELYRLIHEVTLAADDLLLRGERDGETLRERAGQLNAPLDGVVATLRPTIGTSAGLGNAATRRAKEQIGPVKQLDERIKQQDWTEAHQKLEELLRAADEVGRFAEAADSEPLFRPLLERAPQVRLGYLTKRKPTLVPALRDEFTGLRPDVDGMRKQLIAVADAARERHALRWNEQPITGPELLDQLASAWPQIDESVLKAAAVLHAIGASAEPDLRSLQSDYEATRVQAITLVRELILADAETTKASEVAPRYESYLAIIPRFMAALHGTPENAAGSAAALNQLAGKSPALEAKIRAYRAATSDALRWRRRIARRYLDKFHEQKPAQALTTLLTRPPARGTGDQTGAPVLPGQQTPPDQRRATRTVWSIEQPPESVAATWTNEWNGTPALIAAGTVRWPASGNPIFQTPWHSRVLAELEFPRQRVMDCITHLTRDLLLTKDRPPLTLEAALAVHTAAYGPYHELSGTLEGAMLENVPDRLFDLHDPNDVSGALTASGLVSYPAMPALVRLQFKPTWIAHDLFVELPEPPAASTPTPPKSPPVTPPVASDKPPTPNAGEARTGGAATNEPRTGPLPAAPSGAAGPAGPTAAPPVAPGGAVSPPVKKETAPKPPPGGVRF
jgi:hypothetical protein